MKVYLADFFSHKDRVGKYAAELEALGITVTARWFNEMVPHSVTMKDLPDEYHRETAVTDIMDIMNADVLVLFTGTDADYASIPPASGARGGRHFESGFMYGLMTNPYSRRKLIICGKKENIFHHLDCQGIATGMPCIKQIPTWEEVKQELTRITNAAQPGTRAVA
jgi:hypothetical protein